MSAKWQNKAIPNNVKRTKVGKVKKYQPLDMTEIFKAQDADTVASKSTQTPVHNNADPLDQAMGKLSLKVGGKGGGSNRRRRRNKPKVVTDVRNSEKVACFLTTFTCFSDLPGELRAKIWFFAAMLPRILEVGQGPAITPRGSAAPAILYTSRESRAEAQKVYRLWDLNGCDPDNAANRLTYFNPAVDVLYFGEGNSLQSVVILLSRASFLRDQEIQRVAIMCSGKLRENYRGCSFMQALHGIDEHNAGSDFYKGCRGLKEVFFCVPSQLMEPNAGEVEQNMWFRPSRLDGRTVGQIKIKHELEADIDLIQSGRGLDDSGQNKWIGDDMPKFHFVSLAPSSHMDAKVLDAISVNSVNASRLRHANFSMAREIEAQTRCTLTVPQREWATQRQFEVGISGKPEDIEQAKKMIPDRLERVNAEIKARKKRQEGTANAVYHGKKKYHAK